MSAIILPLKGDRHASKVLDVVCPAASHRSSAFVIAVATLAAAPTSAFAQQTVVFVDADSTNVTAPSEVDVELCLALVSDFANQLGTKHSEGRSRAAVRVALIRHEHRLCRHRIE